MPQAYVDVRLKGAYVCMNARVHTFLDVHNTYACGNQILHISLLCKFSVVIYFQEQILEWSESV